MKLEVGMYVRTKNRGIAKFRGWNAYDENKVAIHTHNEGDIEITPIIDKNTIIKASYNIIDLIEVGDYVNGLRVEKNKYGELYTSYVYYGGDIGKQCEVYTTWLKELKEDMIYSIVTHEQMEQMEYKIGE